MWFFLNIMNVTPCMQSLIELYLIIFLYILFRRGRLNTQNTPLGIKHPANTQKSSRYGNAFSRVCLCVSVCLSVMLKLLKALTYKQFIFGTEVCL